MTMPHDPENAQMGGKVTITSTGADQPAGIRPDVVVLLARFARAYEERSFTEMHDLMSESYAGNFAGRKTAEGFIAVIHNYRRQMPFFMRVRMSITLGGVRHDGAQRFEGVIEMTTRAKLFGCFLEKAFKTPRLLFRAAPAKSGKWQITAVDEIPA